MVVAEVLVASGVASIVVPHLVPQEAAQAWHLPPGAKYLRVTQRRAGRYFYTCHREWPPHRDGPATRWVLFEVRLGVPPERKDSDGAAVPFRGWRIDNEIEEWVRDHKATLIVAAMVKSEPNIEYHTDASAGAKPFVFAGSSWIVFRVQLDGSLEIDDERGGHHPDDDEYRELESKVRAELECNVDAVRELVEANKERISQVMAETDEAIEAENRRRKAAEADANEKIEAANRQADTAQRKADAAEQEAIVANERQQAAKIAEQEAIERQQSAEAEASAAEEKATKAEAEAKEADASAERARRDADAAQEIVAEADREAQRARAKADEVKKMAQEAEGQTREAFQQVFKDVEAKVEAAKKEAEAKVEEEERKARDAELKADQARTSAERAESEATQRKAAADENAKEAKSAADAAGRLKDSAEIEARRAQAAAQEANKRQQAAEASARGAIEAWTERRKAAEEKATRAWQKTREQIRQAEEGLAKRRADADRDAQAAVDAANERVQCAKKEEEKQMAMIDEEVKRTDIEAEQALKAARRKAAEAEDLRIAVQAQQEEAHAAIAQRQQAEALRQKAIKDAKQAEEEARAAVQYADATRQQAADTRKQAEAAKEAAQVRLQAEMEAAARHCDPLAECHHIELELVDAKDKKNIDGLRRSLLTAAHAAIHNAEVKRRLEGYPGFPGYRREVVDVVTQALRDAETRRALDETIPFGQTIVHEMGDAEAQHPIRAALQRAQEEQSKLRKRSFKNSHFLSEYKKYELPNSHTDRPVEISHAFHVHSKIKDFLEHYCRVHGINERTLRDKFYDSLVKETASHEAGKILGPVGATAVLLWTSAKSFDSLPSQHAEHRVALYQLMNRALRDDSPALAPTMAAFVKAINDSLIVKPALSAKCYPPIKDGQCCTWRGGGFGVDDPTSDVSSDKLRAWFEEKKRTGASYRVPGLVATSFTKTVAQHFIHMPSKNRERVLWVIHFDPKGRDDVNYRCRHVNFVGASHIGGEDEYLFGAYSAFSVRQVRWDFGDRPIHEIHLDPARDNKAVDENVDLAPWF